ncbi:MAG: DUF2306 domain-containing protein [bacterium]|nr:DUF2306 domain-containing protein [bacterium]
MTVGATPRIAPDRLRPGPLWWLLALPAIGVAGYAILLQDARRLRDTVPGLPWLDEVHFVLGGVALLVGVFAFRRDVLVRRPKVHKKLGMAYCASILGSGLAGLAMAVFSDGGITTHLGFGALALIWLVTTLLGLRAIKRSDIVTHRKWMVRSYAACYAAVTLRVELPLYAWWFGDFGPAYQLVSWTCWVLNLAFAEWWLRRTTVAGVWRRGR